MSLHKTKPNAKGETAKYYGTVLVNYCGEPGKCYCTISRSETSNTQVYVINMVGWDGVGWDEDTVWIKGTNNWRRQWRHYMHCVHVLCMCYDNLMAAQPAAKSTQNPPYVTFITNNM